MRTWTIRDIPILSIHIAQKRSDWPCGEGIAQWEREFDSQASVGTALPRLAEARITATVITRLNPGAFPGPLLPLVIAVDLRHFLPGQFGRREGRWAGGIEDSDKLSQDHPWQVPGPSGALSAHWPNRSRWACGMGFSWAPSNPAARTSCLHVCVVWWGV